MDKLPQISEAEYEIMKIIWDESQILFVKKFHLYTIGVIKQFIRYYLV